MDAAQISAREVCVFVVRIGPDAVIGKPDTSVGEVLDPLPGCGEHRRYRFEVRNESWA